MSAEPALLIDVWSDYVCPFCYLELPVLQRLRAEHGAVVDVAWHAFELRPEPVPTLDPAGDYLRDTWARAVYPMAAERGLLLRLPPVQPRSRLAFEAAEFARDAGRFEAMHGALFRAFFEHGRDLADREVLVDTGRAVGLDADALRAALDAGLHAVRVQQDQHAARRLGIGGVPLLLLRRPGQPLHAGQGLSGAQPWPVLAAAVGRALQEAG